jgi:hypothetical protein
MVFPGEGAKELSSFANQRKKTEYILPVECFFKTTFIIRDAIVFEIFFF